MDPLDVTSPQDNTYAPAHGHVLLLSCMDPRLLDDTVRFMNHDNLCNRYDHVIMAGAALGALGGCLPEYEHWRQTFRDHLAGAHKLHHIEDVYILEHRACGAYHKIFNVADPFGDGPQDHTREEACHYKYASLLKREIHAWAKEHEVKLKVQLFMMDLRGRVHVMHPPKKTLAKK